MANSRCLSLIDDFFMYYFLDTRMYKAKLMQLIVFSCLLWLVPLSANAIGAENLLRAEEAFQVTGKMVGADQLQLSWQISEGYYLYRDKISVTALTPEVVIGKPLLPEGKLKHDDNFGDMIIYREQVTVTLPVTYPKTFDNFKIQVKHQGCADVGVCYPPQKNTLDIKLISPAATNEGKNLLDVLTAKVPATEQQLLPAEQAFQLSASIKDAQTIRLNWVIADGYYLYREKINVQLTGDSAGLTLGALQIPPGQPMHDEAFGAVEIYYHSLQVDVPLQRSNPAAQTLSLRVGYQGCAERGVCYSPMHKTVDLALSALAAGTAAPPATSQALSEQDQIISALKHDSFWLTLLSFFGFGLLLAFTPCIFPMIPILSGIIVGKGDKVNTGSAFLLSLSYVVAGAVTYTVFGILAALFGSNLQASLQQPWIIALFSGIFVLLALSMFDFYHLELPKFLQAKLHNSSDKFRNHSYWGAAIMGALSSLIVGPCVAAPLAGALIYIGQTGDAVLGGSALFMMGLGMGVPLLILGASAGKLLPKAGHWLNATKAVFGVVMLAVAVWMLDRILPARLTMLLWAMLLIIPAMYLRALDPLPDTSSNWSRFFKGLGVLMLLYGALLLIGVALGNHNPLKPLQGLSGGMANAQTTAHINFKPVRSVAELDKILADASTAKRIVMLDFYADWCVSCKEMEAYTFSDPAVQQRLNQWVLLKADVTQNTPEDQALLKRFDLVGPPATLFFDTQQQEQRQYRVIGFQEATQFLAGIKGLD